MEDKTKEYLIKIPSSPIVTIETLWKTLKIIAKTGRVFEEENLLANGASVNEKNLFRVLAYLKYLGFVYEKRFRERQNENTVNVQKWFERENKEVTDFFFYLRDVREKEAKEKFMGIIKSHVLYLATKEELLKNRPTATKIEIKDYLRGKLPGKSPAYYDYGAMFLIRLLKFCGLVTYDGNFMSLTDTNENSEKETSIEENNVPETSKNETSLKIGLGENKYIVSIQGKNANFEFPVNDKEDLLDVESILGIIKRKLS